MGVLQQACIAAEPLPCLANSASNADAGMLISITACLSCNSSLSGLISSGLSLSLLQSYVIYSSSLSWPISSTGSRFHGHSAFTPGTCQGIAMSRSILPAHNFIPAHADTSMLNRMHARSHGHVAP
eukprot:663215-Pelagomonas_calceolata.AAC.1